MGRSYGSELWVGDMGRRYGSEISLWVGDLLWVRRRSGEMSTVALDAAGCGGLSMLAPPCPAQRAAVRMRESEWRTCFSLPLSACPASHVLDIRGTTIENCIHLLPKTQSRESCRATVTRETQDSTVTLVSGPSGARTLHPIHAHTALGFG